MKPAEVIGPGVLLALAAYVVWTAFRAPPPGAGAGRALPGGWLRVSKEGARLDPRSSGFVLEHRYVLFHALPGGDRCVRGLYALARREGGALVFSPVQVPSRTSRLAQWAAARGEVLEHEFLDVTLDSYEVSDPSCSAWSSLPEARGA